jgi:hypothetical protein
MSTQFEPRSVDSMFATIIAKQESDTQSRDSFRLEMRERFERGSSRMDHQDTILSEIKTQAIRTNGRVTRLEEAELSRRIEQLEIAEVAQRTETARRQGVIWTIGGIFGFVQIIGMAVFSWWLSKK